MQAAITSNKNIRTFVWSLQCLAKVGEDLIIEATSDHLVLRTLNNSQAAYAHFTFNLMFFGPRSFVVSGDESVKCKINLRTCLSAFKAVGSMTHLAIAINAEDELLELSIESESGLMRTYQFDFVVQDNILQADFSRDMCPNRLVVPGKILRRCVGYFRLSLPELTLVPERDNLLLRSVIDGMDAQKAFQTLRTEARIDRDDFSVFDVSARARNDEITFCIAEFKAILQFCEQTDSDVHFFFNRGGLPVLISNSEVPDALCCADLVVATQQDDDDDDDRDAGEHHDRQYAGDDARLQSQDASQLSDTRENESDSVYNSQGAGVPYSSRLSQQQFARAQPGPVNNAPSQTPSQAQSQAQSQSQTQSQVREFVATGSSSFSSSPSPSMPSPALPCINTKHKRKRKHDTNTQVEEGDYVAPTPDAELARARSNDGIKGAPKRACQRH